MYLEGLWYIFMDIDYTILYISKFLRKYTYLNVIICQFMNIIFN